MAGTTNLQQWNPTAANQETDAQYAADSQRSSGASNPSQFDAKLANKLFYQLSTFLFALFTSFANKGFTTSDSSASSLTAQCNNFLTTADVLPGLQTVGYAPTLVLDCSKADGFQVTLTGNVTSLTIVNSTFGQTVTLAFTQDSVGGRTVALSTAGNLLSPGVIDTTSNLTSRQTFQRLGDGNLHPSTVMTVS